MKRLVNLIPLVLAIVILALLTVVGWRWLDRYVETPVIDIRASRDRPELALPVYAQFEVSQTLKVHDITNITKIKLPMLVKDPKLPFVISMVWNDHIIGEWLLSDVVSRGENEAQDVELKFSPPVLIDQDFEIRFDGSAIPHDQRDTAPRLFTESAGYNYAEGNYRIADNEKDGDIGMTVFEREKKWQQIANHWYKRPRLGVVEGAQVLLLLMLAMSFPYVLWRIVVK